MKAMSVKKRIFISNTMMVLLTLISFFVVNILFLKFYIKMMESDLILSAKQIMMTKGIEDFVEFLTLHSNKFLFLFVIDGLVCIFILFIISQLFTYHLSKTIMTPLNYLTAATSRIKMNDLTKPIEYDGDEEFKEVIQTFNEMQSDLLESYLKNQKYEKSRDDMIAGISHDLRTPLTAIKGTMKCLIDGVVDTPEKKMQFIQMAYARSEEMELLLDQLFYISRLKTNHISINKQFIDLNQYLNQYVLSKRKVLPNYVHIILKSVDAITINVDGMQLQRILDNLIENSIKYVDKDVVDIQIEAIKCENEVEICLSDNGTGVSTNQLSKIFEEFYRVDPSRNDKEGHGLGLYIVKSLVELMNGHIEATNDRGLCIKMYFKLEREDGNG